eukprot:213747_1
MRLVMDSTELFCKRRLYAEVQIQCDMKEYVAACYFKCDKDNYVQCLNDPAIVDTQYRLHRNHLFDCKLDEQDKKKLRDYTTDDGNHINIDTYVRGHVIGPMEGDWDNINDWDNIWRINRSMQMMKLVLYTERKAKMVATLTLPLVCTKCAVLCL